VYVKLLIVESVDVARTIEYPVSEVQPAPQTGIALVGTSKRDLTREELLMLYCDKPYVVVTDSPLLVWLVTLTKTLVLEFVLIKPMAWYDVVTLPEVVIEPMLIEAPTAPVETVTGVNVKTLVGVDVIRLYAR